MSARVAVITTLFDEPPERVTALLAALAEQDVEEPFTVVAAVAPDAVPIITNQRPWGAVARVVPVVNPSGARSAGLNLAAREAEAEIVCRVDARSRPSPHHVRRSCEILERDAAVAVAGGIQAPVPGARGTQAAGVSRALANPWALGGAAYRRGGRAGPVDTVYLGTFRRSELLAIGGFDERLDANEDFELCSRFRAEGRVVWLDPELTVAYEARTTLPAVWRQYAAFGESKVTFWSITGARPQPRQLAPLAAVPAATVALAAAARFRRTRFAVAAAIAALAVLDTIGGRGAASLATRVMAVATYPVVWTAWTAGVGRGLLRRLRAGRLFRAGSAKPS